jgi:hypothetical protein
VEAEGAGLAGIYVTKDGYYGSGLEYYFVNDIIKMDDYRAKKGKPWQPWDPTVKVIIKRVIKPIPMFARDTNVGNETPDEALALDQDMKWDMFEDQWLPPFGKGKVGDLVVRFSRSISGTKGSCSMTVKFGNKYDGLIPVNDLVGTESRLQFPREAPADGYDMKSYSASILEDEDEADRVYKEEPSVFPKAYFIRLRTMLDEKGRVASAIYGKITTDISGGMVVKNVGDGKVITRISPAVPERPIRLQWVYAGEKGRLIDMDMVYYLNPTPNDRNLEFDGKTNKAGNGTYNRVFQP